MRLRHEPPSARTVLVCRSSTSPQIAYSTGSPPNYQYVSTINYTYDVGGRLTQVADSTTGAGTITRGYDDLDRLTSETQPNAPSPGVLYTYRADGTRQTMTVPGQSQITYGYNNAGQVTSLTQGSTVVSLDYFADGRLQTLTLKPSPTPITQSYAYDDAGDLSQISYTHGASTDDLSTRSSGKPSIRSA